MCYIHKIIAIFAIEYVSDCLHNSRPDIGADTEFPLASRMDRLHCPIPSWRESGGDSHYP